MCETKIKKAIFALLLIPLFSVLSAFGLSTAANHTASAAAYCTNSSSDYAIKAGSSDVTETRTEQYLTGAPGVSGTTCQTRTTTETYKQDGSTEAKLLLYAQDGDTNASNTSCGDTITFGSTPKNNTALPATLQRYRVSGFYCVKDGNSSKISVVVDPSAKVNTTVTSTDTTADVAPSTCAIQAVGWILCPVINLMSSLADSAMTFLSDSFLSVNTGLYDTNSGTYTAWQGILGFANVVFVVIFLIIIFSQATGIGISNYGIKKMLPKIIIGVILINISYFICQLAVDASNVLGFGFNTFFDNILKTLHNPDGSDAWNGIQNNTWQAQTGPILAAAGGATLLYFNLALLVPVLLVALAAVLFIFLILIIRQALIVICIIIAPLAFAAWLLPNTEKLFKQWWGIFSKMLLIFPIIAIVFGASKLTSTVLRTAYTNVNPISGAGAANAGANFSETVGQVIAAGILVVPLFTVPLILKGALDAIPVLGGAIQKRYNGATGAARDRGKKSKLYQYEQQRKASRDASIAAGTYNRKNPLGVVSAANRRLNKNKGYNLVTRGYGAQIGLAAQGENKKQASETFEHFGEDDGTMSVYERTGGNATEAELRGLRKIEPTTGLPTSDRLLDDGQIEQYMRLKQRKLNQSYASHLAVGQYLAGEGKGEFEDIVASLGNAQKYGATSAEMAQATAQITAKIRSSGDAYRLAQFKSFVDTNKDASTGQVDFAKVMREKAKIDPTTGQIDLSSAMKPMADIENQATTKEYDLISPDKFNRFALKGRNPTEIASKKKALEDWLNYTDPAAPTDPTRRSENVRRMLQGFTTMEQRAKTPELTKMIVDAANNAASMRGYAGGTFTGIEQANEYFKIST